MPYYVFQNAPAAYPASEREEVARLKGKGYLGATSAPVAA
jgi:hypothetical protein